MSFTSRNERLISYKKLVGKAHTSAEKGASGEVYGSSVQLASSFVFGQEISEQTVQEVTFILEEAPGSQYQGNPSADTGENLPSGQSQTNSNHGFVLKLAQTVTINGVQYSHTNEEQAYVWKNQKLQIVPESFGIQYKPKVYSTADMTTESQMAEDGAQDWILDCFAGLLFMQDIYNSTYPVRLKAYIYTGKYLDEVVQEASESGGIIVGDGLEENQDGSISVNDSVVRTADLPVVNNETITISTGTGISGGDSFTLNDSSSKTISLNLDFSNLNDKTTDIDGTTEFILQDVDTESRKAASEIKLSVFNNDSGWTSNTGTVTSITTNNGITGGTITSAGNIGLTGQALALHQLSEEGLITKTGDGTVEARTIQGGTGITVSNGSGVSANPTISLSYDIQTSDDAFTSSDTVLMTAAAIAEKIQDSTSGISAGGATPAGGAGQIQFHNGADPAELAASSNLHWNNTTNLLTIGGNAQATKFIGSLEGNAATATKLETSRNISSTGDVSWQVSFDGSSDVSAAAVLSNVGIEGTYTKVTTDEKGRVTAGTQLLATDIPQLTSAKISDFHTAVRTNTLDQMAQPTSNVSLNNKKITNLASPTSDNDAANKSYVDGILAANDACWRCKICYFFIV